VDDKTVIEPLGQTVLLSSISRSAAGTGFSPGAVKGWLTVWSGAQRGFDFHLFEGRNFVGRDPICRPNVADGALADFAFNIRISGDRWSVIDLDSDEGILVNGDPVFRRELQDEDWLKVGEILFRVKKL